MPDKEQTLARRKELDIALRELEKENKLIAVDLIDIFCPHSKCTYYSQNGMMLYRDEWSHPSVEAARLSGEIFYKKLAGQSK